MNVKVDGAKLRTIREARLIERADIQEKTGISWTTIARIEGGQATARASTVKKLAKVLEVDIEEFSRGEVVRNKARRKATAS